MRTRNNFQKLISTSRSIHICGLAGSGKTLISLYLGLLYLEQHPFGQIIFFDPERTAYNVDLNRLARSNGITPFLTEKYSFFMPTSHQEVLQILNQYLDNSDIDEILVIIDSLPTLFLTPPPKTDTHTFSISHSVICFLEQLLDRLSKHDYQLIINNQMRALPDSSNPPYYWKERGFMPFAWRLAHIYFDTCLLLEKIRRGTILARIVYSDSLPETSFIFNITNNLRILA